MKLSVEVEQEDIRKWVAWIVAPKSAGLDRISFVDVTALGAISAARDFVERYVYLTNVISLPPEPVTQ
jgi:hypothetical protein